MTAQGPYRCYFFAVSKIFFEKLRYVPEVSENLLSKWQGKKIA